MSNNLPLLWRWFDRNKLSYKHHDEDPINVIDKEFVYSQFLGAHTHNYYTQVQGQLAVCNREYSDYFFGHLIVTRDPAYFDTIRPLLDKFFKDTLLPCLLRGSIAVDTSAYTYQATNSTKIDRKRSTRLSMLVLPRKYCWCDGDESGKMVTCDNELYRREWHHIREKQQAGTSAHAH